MNSHPCHTTIRPARAGDVTTIEALLESVNLPADGVGPHLGDFLCLDRDGEIIGTVGLEVYGEEALLRSLAIADHSQGQGFGGRLYRAIIERAKTRGVSVLFLLTETAEAFFASKGFERVSRDSAGAGVQSSEEFSHLCPQSAACMRLILA
jgi:amino-acid N-acetyltransferase